jgi:hypothetical protein
MHCLQHVVNQGSPLSRRFQCGVPVQQTRDLFDGQPLLFGARLSDRLRRPGVRQSFQPPKDGLVVVFPLFLKGQYFT